LQHLLGGGLLNKKLKKIVLVIFVFVLIALFWFLFKNISAEQLRDYINNFGLWAPVIYILLFTLLPIAFFPVAVLALACGLLFGFWEATLYTMIGAFFNSTLMFYLAKVLAQKQVTAFLHKRLPAKWSKVLLEIDPQREFWVIFILRLIPLVPYNLINYGAGLTSIKFKNYTLATMLGILPGTLVFLNIGDKVVDIHDPSFVIAIVLLAVLIAVSLIVSKKISPEKMSNNAISEERQSIK